MGLQDLSLRGFGGLIDPLPCSSLPAHQRGDLTYFASWAWAASKGV